MRTVIPAGITAGAVAGLIQYAVNEVRVVRLQLLARGSRVEGAKEVRSESPVPSDSPVGRAVTGEKAGGPALPTKTAFEEPMRHDTSANTLPARMMSGLSSFLPVRKLSDDEYASTLEKRRGEIDKRLKEIAVEEMRFYEASLKLEQQGRAP